MHICLHHLFFAASLRNSYIITFVPDTLTRSLFIYYKKQHTFKVFSLNITWSTYVNKCCYNPVLVLLFNKIKGKMAKCLQYAIFSIVIAWDNVIQWVILYVREALSNFHSIHCINIQDYWNIPQQGQQVHISRQIKKISWELFIISTKFTSILMSQKPCPILIV